MGLQKYVSFWKKIEQYKKNNEANGLELFLQNEKINVQKYIEFWEAIEKSKQAGHETLRLFLEAEDSGLFIGDAIPNKEFWDKVQNYSENDNDADMTKITVDGDDTNIPMEYVNKVDQACNILRKEKVQYETVLRVILDNVFNGYELIKHILDNLVDKIEDECSKCVDSTSCTDEHSKARIKINLGQMFKLSQEDAKEELDEKVKLLLGDLIGIRRKTKFDREKHTLGNDQEVKELFQHPVIEILIWKKWKHYKLNYIHHLRLFTLFVFLFTFFVRFSILDASKTSCDTNTNSNKNMSCSDWEQVENGKEFQKWIEEISGVLPKDTKQKNNTHFTAIVFRNKPENFVIYTVGMVVLILHQVISLIVRYLIFTCKKNKLYRKRKAQAIIINFGNILYIILANIVCFHDSELLRWTLFGICILLVIREVIQLKLNWKKYLREPESYLRLICIIGVLITIFSDTWALQNDKVSCGVFRGVVALGVFSAWTLIFIRLGNVSSSEMGNFIKMFYNIIKTKLLAYIQVCFLLMIAFTLAFWIILVDHTNKGSAFSNGFWSNIVFTVTMSTGEFNTGEFYNGINPSQTATKIFAMVFLIGLVIFSTITMINLLVAAIIDDHGKMKEKVQLDNLFSIADYVVEEEEIEEEPVMVWYFAYNKIVEKLYKYLIGDLENNVKVVLEYCPRTICTSCNIEPLPTDRPAFSPVIEDAERETLLVRLLQLRGHKDQPCVFHDNRDDTKILIDLLKKRIA